AATAARTAEAGGRLRLRPQGREGGDAGRAVRVDRAGRTAAGPARHRVVRLADEPATGAGPAGVAGLRAAGAVPDEPGRLQQPDRLPGREPPGPQPRPVRRGGDRAAREVPPLRPAAD